MAFLRAAAVEELWSGALEARTVEGTPVLLVRIGDRVVAYLDRCVHMGVPLSKGRLDRTVLTCSAHEWQFDVCTGQGINPRAARLRELPVRIAGGEVFVEVGGNPG